MKAEENSIKNFELNEGLKDLVIARIETTIKPNIGLSIGSGQSLSKEEMIDHVRSGDSTGKQIAMIHFNFIRAQASGQITDLLNSI